MRRSTMPFIVYARVAQCLACGFCLIVLVASVIKQDNNKCSISNMARLNNFTFHQFSGKWYHILYLANGGNPVRGLEPRTLEFIELPGNNTGLGLLYVSGLYSPQRRAKSMTNDICCNATLNMEATDSPYRFQLKYPSNIPERAHYSDIWIVNTDYVNFAVILGCSRYYRNTTDCINPYCWIITREVLFPVEISMHIIDTLSEMCLQDENFILSDQESSCPAANVNVSFDDLQCVTTAPSPSSPSPDVVNHDADSGDLILSESSEGASRFILKDRQGNPCLLASFNAEFRISYTTFQKNRITVSSIDTGLDEQLSVSGSCMHDNASTAILRVLWIKKAIDLTLTFSTEQKVNSETFWFLSRVGLNYNSNIYRLFPHAYEPAKRHAISKHLHLYTTPVGFSYQCDTGDDIELTENNDLNHKVVLQNLYLQPTGTQGLDHFNRAIICQRDFTERERQNENKIVIILLVSFVAVLLILFAISLVVDRLKKYNAYRYRIVK